jgi:NAD-dependent deacetylase
MPIIMNREEAAERLKKARRIVFFGGAGTSTESGIPDFRSPGGVYDQIPEYVLSHQCMMREPERFFSFYRENLLFPDAKPNQGHHVLAKWEREGRLSGVITQNIDGLHQAAGSVNVFELHGSVRKNTCMHCKKTYAPEDIPQKPIVPRCTCGAIIRPDVVLFGEPLDEAVVDGAIHLLSQADALLVAGTSLSVYPAAGFLRYFRGDMMIINNKTATNMDRKADLVLREGFSESMKWLDSEWEK